MEHAAKGLAAIAAWAAPAWMVVMTNNPWLALTFIASFVATFVWFASDYPRKTQPGEHDPDD